MKKSTIMTFEQFKIDKKSVGKVDEAFGFSYNKKITSFIEDIKSGTLKKTADLKELRDKFHAWMKIQGAGYVPQAVKLTKELDEFLANPKKMEVSESLEKAIAIVVIKVPKVAKNKKGKWKSVTKIAPDGTGGANAAKWN